MKNLLKILYGNLRFKKKSDYLIIPMKFAYIAFSLPFLLFALLLTKKSFGALGNPNNGKFGIGKIILLHIADIFWSSAVWVFTVNTILGNYYT